jgi:TPR repeat protein
MKKRIKADDPVALRQMGGERYHEGGYYNAFKYLSKGADLGDLGAHYLLGLMYWKGQFVEKDEDKAAYHWEKAAIGGHPQARHELAVMEARNGKNLAVIEQGNGNMKRAVKHFIIAANLGEEKSMKALREHYSLGNITKEDLDATLLSHQAALDAAKSEQREEAEISWQLLQRLEDELAKSEQRKEAEEVSRSRGELGLGEGLMAHIYG